ncbi:pirin family protein [Campylobacter sp. RM16187]|uniref:pirin family protein n=1 Tax=Campylobacter sp. RM16187 TaxID=1660063 RepID=UPI0021B5C7A0|nr:pirin family protein [Campylobacter sp. RM16187]QKG28436.1 pirin family protein [Campylobacter sp. RM16187]
MRKVNKIYKPNAAHWVGDGFLVQPLFTHMGENRGTDPFLMLDYVAPMVFKPNLTDHPRGVGRHPHKGFETVTIAYSGEVAHKDSSGGGGVIRAGDVQWMTAGAGIVHEEFHSQDFRASGGLFEIVQLWVNLPSRYKNTPPKYQHLSRENIPVVKFADGAGQARVIAGEFEGVQGAANTFTPINVWDVTINSLKEASINVPATHTLFIVVLRGEVTFNGSESASEARLVNFEVNGGEVKVKAGKEDAKILLLSGEPINEPVVGYGPFVMNTRDEIRQAIEDYNSGKFGDIS